MMKPPFWEVTISRQVAAGAMPIIESVSCFADKNTAEEYQNQACRENPSVCATMAHVDAGLADGISVSADPWIAPAAITTKTRRRSVPA